MNRLSEFVSLEQAKRLQECGFPQNEWPQMVYATNRVFSENYVCQWAGSTVSESAGVRLCGGAILPVWVAAPTYLRALEWLEREQRWHWSRGNAVWFAFREQEPWLPAEALTRFPRPEGYETPSALLDAILTTLQVPVL